MDKANIAQELVDTLSTEQLLMLSFSSHLAKAVKENRKKKGWTQEDLARESGIDRVTIARIETKLRVPQIQSLLKLLHALDLNLAIDEYPSSGQMGVE